MDENAVIEARYAAIGEGEYILAHSEWARTNPISINRYWSGDPAPPSRHAEGRMLWSEEWLAIRFVCNQTGPLLVSSDPQVQQKTIGLWHRDVCEIFLAPDPQQPNRYFEFEAAPTGEWVDLAIELTPTGRVTDFKFQSGVTVDTRVADNQLVIGVVIPWSHSIAKPEAGDRWRCNLFRCVGRGNERYLAWQPTYTKEPNFHVPEAFGELRFR
ncbi:MAG: carbohydrate-binding family 9-like protein [Pyrinomonadaceae bacterium]